MAVQSKTWIFCSHQITISLGHGVRITVSAHCMNVRHQHALGAHEACQAHARHLGYIRPVCQAWAFAPC